MKLAALVSGGKDSLFATYLASKYHEIVCLITMASDNKFSYMFHTPSVSKVVKQGEQMNVPVLVQKTAGEKEEELKDLKQAIADAQKEFCIEGIVVGAVESVYQSERVQKICNELSLEVFCPLWQKNQIELLQDLIAQDFEVIVVGVAAHPLGEAWLGRKIDDTFVSDMKQLQKEFGINPAGEGGEYETFVLNCPLFSESLTVTDSTIEGEGNTYHMEVSI